MTNFNSKKGKRRSFSYETKASIPFIPIRTMCLWCPILKRNEIIMWIHVCPIQWMNINSKNYRQRFFLVIPKHQYQLSQWGQSIYGAQSWKERRFCPNQWTNINPKNCRKRSFSYETKASISFIPIRIMCLYYPILKRKEIITWICDWPNLWTNINSKNSRKKSFSYEPKASISFMPIRRICLWCPTMKKRGLL